MTALNGTMFSVPDELVILILHIRKSIALACASSTEGFDNTDVLRNVTVSNSTSKITPNIPSESAIQLACMCNC